MPALLLGSPGHMYLSEPYSLEPQLRVTQIKSRHQGNKGQEHSFTGHSTLGPYSQQHPQHLQSSVITSWFFSSISLKSPAVTNGNKVGSIFEKQFYDSMERERKKTFNNMIK